LKGSRSRDLPSILILFAGIDRQQEKSGGQQHFAQTGESFSICSVISVWLSRLVSAPIWFECPFAIIIEEAGVARGA
jgi:hypothetical protein